MKNIYYIVALVLSAPYAFKGCKPKPDRLDSIVKDLPANSYSLSFDKAYPQQGINKTSYGTENFIVYAEPEDVKCGTDWRRRFPTKPIPVWSGINKVIPTCPKFVPIDIAGLIKNVISDAGDTYRGLREIRTFNANNVLLANENFTGRFASLKPDVMDDSILNGLDYDKFLMLDDAASLAPGFNRNFYGSAQIAFGDDASSKSNNEVVLKNKDVVVKFWRKYIGCFDPDILKIIRDRLAAFDPGRFKNWQVNKLDNNVAVLSR